MQLVIPVQAGIQYQRNDMDSRLRGNDAHLSCWDVVCGRGDKGRAKEKLFLLRAFSSDGINHETSVLAACSKAS